MAHGPEAASTVPMSMSVPLPPQGKADLEEGLSFAPRFGPDGLMPCIAVDAGTGDVLMLAYMNAASLSKTVATGEAWYWSRSRGELWHKGATSGQVQTVVEMRVDCDQDALLIRVRVGGDGGACHTGRRTCFYRRVTVGGAEPRLESSADP